MLIYHSTKENQRLSKYHTFASEHVATTNRVQMSAPHQIDIPVICSTIEVAGSPATMSSQTPLPTLPSTPPRVATRASGCMPSRCLQPSQCLWPSRRDIAQATCRRPCRRPCHRPCRWPCRRPCRRPCRHHQAVCLCGRSNEPEFAIRPSIASTAPSNAAWTVANQHVAASTRSYFAPLHKHRN